MGQSIGGESIRSRRLQILSASLTISVELIASGVLDLSYFSLVLRQRLVVGNLQNSAGDCLPECHLRTMEAPFQFLQ